MADDEMSPRERAIARIGLAQVLRLEEGGLAVVDRDALERAIRKAANTIQRDVCSGHPWVASAGFIEETITAAIATTTTEGGER